MSDSLQPNELQHTRFPCPSPTPRVYSDSCALSWWCHPKMCPSPEFHFFFSSFHKAIIYILSERKHMLKLQYFGHLTWRTDSLEKILMLKKLKAGGEGDDRAWDGWMASLTRWTWIWVHSGSWWWTGKPGVLRFMGSQRVGHDWATELNWTELNLKSFIPWFWFSSSTSWS